MNSTKIIIGLALIAFCSIPLSHSLKCFVCDSKYSCQKPPLLECNPALANATRFYLQRNHSGVPTNATSRSYECISESIKATVYDTHYQSCTYSNVGGCQYPVYGQNYTRTCRQCRNKDGCNPAGRIGIDMLSLFVTTIVAVIFRYVKH